MKNILAFVVTVVIAYFITQFGAWYMVAISGFVGGLITRKPFRGFLVAFLAVTSLWLVQFWLLSAASPSNLPDRMGALIGVGSRLTLMLVSALIGGLVAGSAGAAGGVLFKQKKKRRRY